MGLIQEFKEFAVKGNALDMAVGIILGAAFNKVVTSLVGDIIMPPIGMAMGKVDFKDLRVVMQPGVAVVKDAAGNVTTPEVAEVAVRYGAFINETINFLIVAFSVFMIVKVMNKVIKAREIVKVI
ncbi:MAG: large conductance mechanosensitive channel protein MscL [Planctomycetes bacterium]|nr:large conductance mechanosensitive channel protein MscL [Planctomycetota bacterium]